MDFNSILIGSEDPGRLAEYYTRLLDEPVMAAAGYTGWQIGSGFLTVGPHSQVHGQNPQPGRLIWNIEAADVRGEFERMKAAGAIVVAEPYQMEGGPTDTPEMWIATLADPDDNYFQLMSPFQP